MLHEATQDLDAEDDASDSPNDQSESEKQDLLAFSEVEALVSLTVYITMRTL
jgi:hypothetical protein